MSHLIINAAITLTDVGITLLQATCSDCGNRGTLVGLATNCVNVRPHWNAWDLMERGPFLRYVLNGWPMDWTATDLEGVRIVFEAVRDWLGEGIPWDQVVDLAETLVDALPVESLKLLAAL